MKIATWNCNMAFRNKHELLCDEDPDVLVVQECEDPSYNGSWNEFTDWKWIGENRNKGLGIFTRNGHTLDRINTEQPDCQYVLPVKINESITLLGVWAMNDEQQPAKRYIGQVYTAVQHYDCIDERTVVTGDFNWNVIWDDSPSPSLCGDFDAVTTQLSAAGLVSAYHYCSGVDYGDEPDPTFYMHKKETRPYHTDYVFVPESALRATSMRVGAYSDWIDASDHMPLLVDIEPPRV